MTVISDHSAGENSKAAGPGDPLERFEAVLNRFAGKRGFALTSRKIDYGIQFHLSSESAFSLCLNAYRTGKFYVLDGKRLPDELTGELNKIKNDFDPKPLENLCTRLSEESRAKVRNYFQEKYGQPAFSPGKKYEYVYKVKSNKESYEIKQYRSGLFCMEGKGAAAASADLNAVQSRVSEDEQIRIFSEEPMLYPYIGTDEAGKGDYFGPLVSAAVMVDSNKEEILQTLGVKDSKTLSDKKIFELAGQIKQVCGENSCSIVELPPARYNTLYSQFFSEGKKLNHLLAWTHARAVKNILQHGLRPKMIITDRFTRQAYLKQRLGDAAAEIKLNQFAGGERYTGVAAASILARNAFLKYLKNASDRSGINIPRGASAKTVETATAIYKRWGIEGLSHIAKLHFKTTLKVTGRNWKELT